MYKIIEKILKEEKAKGIINVRLMDDEEIKKLNLRFRSKDKSTDVLAFALGEDGILGEVAISVETARRNAKRYGVALKEEMKRLMVHGALHVLGYDHGKKMNYAEKIYQKL